MELIQECNSAVRLMPLIAFIDIEVNPETGKILDLGAELDSGAKFHENSLPKFYEFIKNIDFVCGHNILRHDLKYIELKGKFFIDTLFWSPLLFPKKPSHKLPKDNKLLDNELSNPLSDSIKAKDLFHEELAAFEKLDKDLKNIFYFLLHSKAEFSGLFKYLGKEDNIKIPKDFIIQKIHNMEICKNAPLNEFIEKQPIELAYGLALLNANDSYSMIPPWVLENFPKTETLLKKLRNTPCKEMCSYCQRKLNVKTGLKHFFGFGNFRKYAGEPLQEKAADLAIKGESILVMFPTGGGKSIAFQVPALMSGENERGLTVVISPLQSLMKDQVDNLEKDGKTSAVTINGLLDPIEKADVIKRVREGSVHLLYIAPESLRSNTIERLLLQRNIVRFVIDEAHCFSAWGQDFRPDYLYIADFIKKLQDKKNCESIPVSCFTATAKPEIMEDICEYFNKKLGLNLEIIKAKSSRENLTYKIIKKETEDKYTELRNIIKSKNCPSIVYVSRTKTANELAEKLCKDEFNAKSFHGKLDKDVKIQNQNEFMQGLVQIIVATNAFGMGVDKKDVGLVVHYNISDSLENYLQEAGRAGRDENIKADCYILFDESDLDEYFSRLNKNKLNIDEIKQIWSKAIKEFSEKRNKFQKSALEIARKAGWDDSSDETNTIETRVISAANALEQSNYIKRENNSPRVFADSIMLKTMQEVSQKIELSKKFINDKQKEDAKRIMSSLFSSKARQKNKEKAEERIDYIADILGLKIKDAIEIVNILREEKILADARDIIVFIDDKKANKTLKEFVELEKFLISQISQEEKHLHIKELNEQANSSVAKIKTVLNFLAISHLVERHISGNRIDIHATKSKQELEENLEKRTLVSYFTLKYLDKIKENNSANFSVLELKDAFNAKNKPFKTEANISEIENALLYLSKIGALNIEGGFLVVYNKLTIEKLENNNRKQYTIEDYKNLSLFYKNRAMQIHIVGEYAKKMLNNEQDALIFASDYFNLENKAFLKKYFNKEQIENLNRSISVTKYKQIFDENLSNIQREIIDNKESACIVVAAGPGSGKTKVLVNKLAALLTMEDVKSEQLLMLTFSNAAATEFKERLLKLIGKAAARFVEIKTFHSYCFNLLGRNGNLENEKIIEEVVEKIKNGEIEQNRITKTCLVIDEAQDMREEEFEIIKILREENEGMRIIAVGDDDQNIYEFRGSNSKHFTSLLKWENCARYELLENYRSKVNIVDFANNFAKKISNRMKSNPIQAWQKENGEIKIVECKSKHPIWSVVCDVIDTPRSGSTCILAYSNQDVWEIAGMLHKSKYEAEIIQSEDDFPLFNISELRYFYDNLGESAVVLKEHWEEAKRKLNNKFKNTYGLKIAEKMIRKFEQSNEDIKYKTDFEVYASESNLEDFFGEGSDGNIFVSTMHKAKGKEFDNVFIMLNNFSANENKRLLYVAMTRAKSLLHIHFHGVNIFKNMQMEHGIKFMRNDMEYPPVNIVPIFLTHVRTRKHKGYIDLGYSESKQRKIEKLNGNEILDVKDIRQRKGLFAFSKAFEEEIKKRESNGYRIKEISVNLIVYWKGKDIENEIKIILPKVVFEKFL